MLNIFYGISCGSHTKKTGNTIEREARIGSTSPNVTATATIANRTQGTRDGPVKETTGMATK